MSVDLLCDAITNHYLRMATIYEHEVVHTHESHTGRDVHAGLLVPILTHAELDHRHPHMTIRHPIVLQTDHALQG